MKTRGFAYRRINSCAAYVIFTLLAVTTTVLLQAKKCQAEEAALTLTPGGVMSIGSSLGYLMLCHKSGWASDSVLSGFLSALWEGFSEEIAGRIQDQAQTTLVNREQYSAARNTWIPISVNPENCADLSGGIETLTFIINARVSESP